VHDLIILPSFTCTSFVCGVVLVMNIDDTLFNLTLDKKYQ